MTKKHSFEILYVVSFVFTLSGAVNAGFSRYFVAIPFMALMLWISKTKLKSRLILYASIFFIVISVVVSHSQTENPLLFPIISNGYIRILKDGYQQTFSDGSGGFVLNKEKDDAYSGSGPINYTEVKKGDVFNVRAVRIGYPEFSTSIRLVTEIGEFSEDDYAPNDGKGKYVKVNKAVRSTWAKYLSTLIVMWPIPLVIFLSRVRFRNFPI